jgi:hypothetical protein
MGGESFSKLKAGMVYPLVVELKHSWNFLTLRRQALPDRRSLELVSRGPP